MEFNAAELNGVELNAGVLDASGSIIQLPLSNRWALRVLLNGVDVSARLTGRVEVTADENTARTARLSLVPTVGLIDLDAWSGKPLQIFRRRLVGGELVSETLRFTGVTLPAKYDNWRNVVALNATCDRQNRLEQMSIEQINALTVECYWSAAVFGELNSHYQYAEARRQTRPIALDCGPDGAFRVTPWRAAAIPHFTFDASNIVAGSLQVTPSAEKPINRIELAVEYRFTRLRHREHRYQWDHPAANFCAWYPRTTELPTISMLAEAIEQADWDQIGEPAVEELPPDLVNPCGLGGAWYNEFTADPHLLSFSVAVARRTAQTLTEQYNITLLAEGSVTTWGVNLERERYSDEVEYDSRSWETLPADQRPSNAVQDYLGDWVIDRDDGTRRANTLLTALHREAVRMEDSHRHTRVVWATPISDAIYDTAHTLAVNAGGVQAIGKVVAVAEQWDMDRGTELANIELAVYRGGEVSAADPLTAPAQPAFDFGDAPASTTTLATQLGGDQFSPPFDDDLDGFAGNYSVKYPGSEQYQRRLQITTPDIDALYRDGATAEAAASYRLNFPTDLLITEAM